MSLANSRLLQLLIKDNIKKYINNNKPEASRMISNLYIDGTKTCFYVVFLDGSYAIFPFNFSLYESSIIAMEEQEILSSTFLKDCLYDAAKVIPFLKTTFVTVLELLIYPGGFQLDKIALKLFLGICLFFVNESCFEGLYRRDLGKVVKKLENREKIYSLYMGHKEDFKIPLKDPRTQKVHEFCFCNVGHLEYFANAGELEKYLHFVQNNKEDFISYYTELFYSKNDLDEEEMYNALNVPYALNFKLETDEPYCMDEELWDVYGLTAEEEIEKIKAKVLGLDTNME